MTDDLIRRQDAIEVLNAVDVYGDGICFEVLSHAIRDVSLLPTVEAIPVSWIKERLSNIDDTMLEMAWSMLISDWAERKEE